MSVRCVDSQFRLNPARRLMFDSMAISADDDAWIAAAVDHFRRVLASDEMRLELTALA